MAVVGGMEAAAKLPESVSPVTPCELAMEHLCRSESNRPRCLDDFERYFRPRLLVGHPT